MNRLGKVIEKPTQIPKPLDTCAQPLLFPSHFNRKDFSGFEGNATAAMIRAKNSSLLRPDDH